MTTEWIHGSKTALTTMQTAVPASAAMVQSLNFINAEDGFALLTGKPEANGEQKFLLQTKDAGQHWSQISSNADRGFSRWDPVMDSKFNEPAAANSLPLFN